MNGRQRFRNIMFDTPSDRPPLFEDGIREEVLRLWRKQGLRKQDRLEDLFTFDHREEVEPDLNPLPNPTRWPTRISGLIKFKDRLNPDDPRRLPDGWEHKVTEWKLRDYPLILRIHRGFFLSMGVYGWRRFSDAIQLLVDDPGLVHATMDLYTELACQLAEKILSDIDVDAALFSEPISGNHGPLISPAMYTSQVLTSYSPILEVLKAHKVHTIIYRTYSNARALLPSVVQAGFSCLWACECDPKSMNYHEIRREFGKELRLIGGIDSDALRQSPDEIYKAVLDIEPLLSDEGGYIPLADGRVREDVSFTNYIYYRHLLEQVTSGEGYSSNF